MKKLSSNQQGFVTMIVCILAILVTVIVLVFMRVSKATK
jgi:Tfp pilus assembly protein PilX